jgi:hypothetical protein
MLRRFERSRSPGLERPGYVVKNSHAKTGPMPNVVRP